MSRFEYQDDLDIAEEVFGEDVHRSGLDQKVSLRERKWDDLSKRARFARINPPSVLQGSLGQQVTVNQGQTVSVAAWGGDDSETLPVTVTFTPGQQLPTVSALAGVAPFGIVQFGTRAFLATVQVDIGRGCQFTVSASQITLQVGLPSAAAATQAVLSGMLSFYPVTHTTPITRTLDLPSIAPGASSALFAIPAFSRSVFPVRTADAALAGQDLVVDLSDANGNVLQQIVWSSAQVFTIPVLLANAAAFISVDASAAAGASAVSFIFELGL